MKSEMSRASFIWHSFTDTAFSISYASRRTSCAEVSSSAVVGAVSGSSGLGAHRTTWMTTSPTSYGASHAPTLRASGSGNVSLRNTWTTDTARRPQSHSSHAIAPGTTPCRVGLVVSSAYTACSMVEATVYHFNGPEIIGIARPPPHSPP